LEELNQLKFTTEENSFKLNHKNGTSNGNVVTTTNNENKTEKVS
jgi:hypothetical protein